MAPEIAAVYIVGMIPAGLFSSFHFYRRKARANSKTVRQLQKNLRQVNLFWMDLNGSVETYQSSLPAQQDQALKKTFVTAGIATVATSWLGLIFHILIFFSYEKFAVSRFESRLFRSPLVKEDLSGEDVNKLLLELKSI